MSATSIHKDSQYKMVTSTTSNYTVPLLNGSSNNVSLKPFVPTDVLKTKFLFFTGKGGVGKTSCACATAISMANAGKKVFLISTDPASNLQDVFAMSLSNKGTPIYSVPNLVVANLDPVQAANEYRNKVVDPYRGVLPEEVIANMEEQLSGSCTVEIAAFNEFSHFLTASDVVERYDHIIFDTAPTGHTLRMLELPSAWNSFIDSNENGASCLGQLSGLLEQKTIYEKAVQTLGNSARTTLVLVSRAEASPLVEANRASNELFDLGIKNQILILNGLMKEAIISKEKSSDVSLPQSQSDTKDKTSEALVDEIAQAIISKQLQALDDIPLHLKEIPLYFVPLKAFSMNSIHNIESMLNFNDNETALDDLTVDNSGSDILSAKDGFQTQVLDDVVNDLINKQRKIIFTMGKGGVGKTTVAASIAMKLAQKGHAVHLTTTDPACHLQFVVDEMPNLKISIIDEKEALANYSKEVLDNARANGLSDDDIAYIKEDLRSPCTQEIAMFKAFSQLVENSKDSIMVIDTAPTGHTLLLLSSTMSFDKEISRSKGETPSSVKNLLPRLKSSETEVIIVTLPEATPYLEAKRLQEDLNRAEINVNWWVVNNSIINIETKHKMLQAKALHERKWAHVIKEHAQNRMCLIDWQMGTVSFDKLLKL